MEIHSLTEGMRSTFLYGILKPPSKPKLEIQTAPQQLLRSENGTMTFFLVKYGVQKMWVFLCYSSKHHLMKTR
jgi:hypothetical protein